jgi:hypothetical protein
MIYFHQKLFIKAYRDVVEIQYSKLPTKYTRLFFIFNNTDPYCDMSPGSQNNGAEDAAIARQRRQIHMQ